MTLHPVVPLALVAAFVLVGVAVCVQGAWSSVGVLGRARWLTRALVVLAAAAACVRPGAPAELTSASLSDADVYFVLDTTASMGASDGPDGTTRLDAARSDVAAISAQLAGSGARTSLVTFDRVARTVVPLTTDTTAVPRAVAILQPELALTSHGSSITAAAPLLSRTLREVAATYPDRSTVVVYLGDGENTAGGERESFAPLHGLVQGGLVLGYGTTEGAPMTARLSGGGAAPLLDPATGQPAVSHADAAALHALASDLGVGSVARQGGPAPTVPAPTERQVTTDVGGLPPGTTEYTWIAALAVVLLLLLDGAGTVLALGRAALPRGAR
ncbi:vWA domain-containing protein [Cellulomonas sp. URHB0016]